MPDSLIVHTDIGSDCDDMLALIMLLNHHKELFNISLISLGTSREFASKALKCLLNEYRFDISYFQTNKKLECDKIDNYLKEISLSFKSSNNHSSSWKKTYERLDSDIVPIIIGPAYSFAHFIKRNKTLFINKTKKVYMMMGSFNTSLAEWNVLQDKKAMQYVISNITCPCYILPSEVGSKVITGKNLINKRNNVLGSSFYNFFKNQTNKKENEMLRESWDPLTVLAYIKPDLFIERIGDININDDGVSLFKDNPHGLFHILDIKDKSVCENEIEREINNYLETINKFK